MNKETNEVMTDKDVFRQLIKQRFTPTSPEGCENPNEVVQFRTSRELVYELREMCEPTIAEASGVMMELGYQGKPIDGGFAWMLYPMNEE